MTDRYAFMLVIAGLLMIASGCSHPFETAVATANAAAGGLKVTHEQLEQRYRADQVAAAKRAQGNRSDPSVKADQRARVERVRKRYEPAWSAYGFAYEAWVSAVAIIEVARAAYDAGGLPEFGEVAGALLQLAKSQRRLLVAAHEIAGILEGAPPAPGGSP